MNKFLIEQCFEDSSDGADGEFYAVVSFEDVFVDVCDDLFVSVVCCAGEFADLRAKVFVDSLRGPFFPLVDFLQIWFFDGVSACALYFPISLFMPCLYARVEHFIGSAGFFLCDHDWYPLCICLCWLLLQIMPRIRCFEIANHVLAKRASRAHARLQKHSRISLNYHIRFNKMPEWKSFRLPLSYMRLSSACV